MSADEDYAYWLSMVGKPPVKRWYRLLDRYCLAYGMTEVVAQGDDVILKPIGEPEAFSEDGYSHPDNVPAPPRGYGGTMGQRP